MQIFKLRIAADNSDWRSLQIQDCTLKVKYKEVKIVYNIGYF